MGHLRKPRPHETNARERSRDRRERPDVPHSARPISLFRIGQSQAQNPAVLGAIVSFVVLAVVVAIYWRRPSSRAVAATTTRHELRSLNARGRRLLWAFAPAC